MYKIKVEEYKIICVIGCHPHERQKEQILLVDLELNVKEFVDYEKVMTLCGQMAKGAKYKLIENFISDFLDTLFKDFPVMSAKMKVSKPEALLDAKNVFIEVQR